MTGIAVVEVSGGEIEYADKERDEHVHLVALRERVVEGTCNEVGLRLVS